MNNREIALSKKGTFATVKYTKTCKVLRNSPVITKTTKIFNARIGCSYDNLKIVKENRGVETNAESRALNQGLRGMEYVIYPIILKSIKTNKHYLRIETNKNTKFKTIYYKDGKEIDKKDIEKYLQSSEKQKKELPIVMNISMDDILEIK